MMTMTSRGWVMREAVLTNFAHCAESAAAHIRPVSGRRLAPRLLRLIGRNVAEYLAFHHRTHA
jgi:hypothetical protein